MNPFLEIPKATVATSDKKKPGLMIEKMTELITIERAIEILGRENVHGIDDIQYALGKDFVDKKKAPPFPYTEKDMQFLKELKEQGVNVMVMLTVAEKDGTPLKATRVYDLISSRYQELGLGKLLKDESATLLSDTPSRDVPELTYGWSAITTSCLPETMTPDKPGSYFQPHAFQKKAIEGVAFKSGYYAFAGRSRGAPRYMGGIARASFTDMLYGVGIDRIASHRLNPGHERALLKTQFHLSDATEVSYVSLGLGKMDPESGGFICKSRINSRGGEVIWMEKVGACVRIKPLSSIGLKEPNPPPEPHQLFGHKFYT